MASRDRAFSLKSWSQSKQEEQKRRQRRWHKHQKQNRGLNVDHDDKDANEYHAEGVVDGGGGGKYLQRLEDNKERGVGDGDDGNGNANDRIKNKNTRTRISRRRQAQRRKKDTSHYDDDDDDGGGGGGDDHDDGRSECQSTNCSRSSRHRQCRRSRSRSRSQLQQRRPSRRLRNDRRSQSPSSSSSPSSASISYSLTKDRRSRDRHVSQRGQRKRRRSQSLSSSSSTGKRSRDTDGRRRSSEKRAPKGKRQKRKPARHRKEDNCNDHNDDESRSLSGSSSTSSTSVQSRLRRRRKDRGSDTRYRRSRSQREDHCRARRSRGPDGRSRRHDTRRSRRRRSSSRERYRDESRSDRRRRGDVDRHSRRPGRSSRRQPLGYERNFNRSPSSSSSSSSSFSSRSSPSQGSRHRRYRRNYRGDHGEHNRDNNLNYRGRHDNHHRQQNHANGCSSTGVVSDDENFAHNNVGNRASSRHRCDGRENRHMEQEHHHINTSQWDDHSHHSSQGKANQQLERDDKGHFDGMEGSLIGDYRILREVGQGTFGRVVECLDTRQRYSRTGVRDRRPHNSIVAIKVIRNVKRYHDSALIEADIVRSVNRRGGRGITHCAILYDTFTYHGHFCMVFESLGPSLYDFLKDWMNFHPFPADYVRSFAQQLLETVEFLHSFGLIHTDLKCENILLLNAEEKTYRGRTIPASSRVKIIDFGGSTYDDEKKSHIVNTRQYRAPEVILGVGWSMPSDLWSIGCILAELYQGELLFATHDNVEHLALIEKVVGRFPPHMLDWAENRDLVHQSFGSDGNHRMGDVLSDDSVSFILETPRLEAMIRRKDSDLLRLVRNVLVIDPELRATAKECLRHFGDGRTKTV